MRAVWSFWTEPWRARRGRPWLSEKHLLLAWILSFETARRHYPETSLITDDAGAAMLVDGLGLQFGRVSTRLNALADRDPALWMLGKLYAYREQDAAFVHLDNDTFLWQRLSATVESAPVFAQNPEYFSVGSSHYKPDELRHLLTGQTYGWVPAEWEWSLSRGAQQRGECCGVVGGRHTDFIRYFADTAIRLIEHPDNRAAWSARPGRSDDAVTLEQYHLAACIDYHRHRPGSPYRDVEIRYLFESVEQALDPNMAAKIGFTHIWGGTKQNAQIAERLEKRVRADYPGPYERCVDYLARPNGGAKAVSHKKASRPVPVPVAPPPTAPRALLLNIERAAERRAQSLARLRAERLEFEIVDGIDGRLSLPLARLGAWEMKNTELACYYTHCRAYRRLLDYGWPHALILEDDFEILAPGRLATVLDDLPAGCDFLALYRMSVEGNPVRVLDHGEKFNRLRPCALCLPGYVISARLAAHVLANHPLPDRPIDNLFCEISLDPAFGFYERVQPIVSVTGLPSVIHG